MTRPLGIKSAEKLRKSRLWKKQASTLSHAQKPARPWSPAKVTSLALIPGQHKHPTAPGLLLRVSPKLKTVWAYRFRAFGGAEVSGTLGAVRSPTETNGKTLEGALVNRAWSQQG